MATDRPRPADHEVRERVVSDVDASIVLDAGAGSGKTSILVDRIVEIVLAGRAAVDEVAAITFTRAAAASLRLRLRERLGALAACERDADRRGRAAAALEAVDRAPISTIHAFCLRLVAERPVEAGVEPGSIMLDEDSTEEMLRIAWRRFLEDVHADPGRRDELLALRPAVGREKPYSEDEGDDALFAAARELARNRELEPVHDPTPVDLGPMAAALRPVRDELAAALALCVDAKAGKLDVWRGNVSVVERLSGDDDAERRRTLALWGGSRGALAVTAGSQSGWRPKETLARVKDLARTAAGIAAEFHGRVMVEAHGRLVALLCGPVPGRTRAAGRSFLAHYERVKREAAALDFLDLLLKARDLLARPDGPRADLARRYPYLLVDEFQDTDPVQVEVAALLSASIRKYDDVSRSSQVPDGAPSALSPEPASSSPNLRVDGLSGIGPGAGERGRIFVVGDPKQSIYRFRRADVASYEAFGRAVAEAGGRRETLTVGFRTVPALLRWINGAFGRVLPDYVPIEAYRRDERAPALHVLPVDVPGAERPTVEAVSAREALLLGNLVAQWIRGARPLLVERDGDWRPCGPGDVMVLVRRATNLGALEEAFSRLGIPAAFEGGRTFFARVEVQALLAVLKAVLDPSDRCSVACALRSVFVSAPDTAIAEHLLRDGGRSGTPADPPVREALEAIDALHALAHEAPPGEVVGAAIDRFLVRESLLVQPGGATRARAVDKLEALAAGRPGTGLRAFAGFVRDLERKVEAGAAEPEISTGDPSELVQVTTIHKAKGLERPVVVLADCVAPEIRKPTVAVRRGEGASGRARPGTIAVTIGPLVPPGWAQAEEEETAQQLAESRRLLYVACTRARDHLVIVAPPPSGRPGRFVTPLLSELPDPARPGVFEAHGATVEILDPETLSADLPSQPPPMDEAEMDAAAPAVLGPDRAARDALAAEIERRARPVAPLVSVTRLAAVDAPPAATPRGGRGPEFGALVHGLLESAGPAFEPPARPVAEALARRVGADPSDVEPATAFVARLAGHPLIRRALAARRALREVPVAFPRGDIVVNGVVDLLFEEPDGFVVVDYKTDAVSTPGEIAAQTAHHMPQLDLYAEALEAAGLHVKERHVLFVCAP